jgi:hypothetical protein
MFPDRTQQQTSLVKHIDLYQNADMELDSDIAVEKASGSVSMEPGSPTAKDVNAVDTFSSAEYRKLIWKLDMRLLPPLFVLWFISLIDRVNIGTARIQGLEKDLGMNPLSTQFNIATGMCLNKTHKKFNRTRSSSRGICRPHARRGS